MNRLRPFISLLLSLAVLPACARGQSLIAGPQTNYDLSRAVERVDTPPLWIGYPSTNYSTYKVANRLYFLGSPTASIRSEANGLRVSSQENNGQQCDRDIPNPTMWARECAFLAQASHPTFGLRTKAATQFLRVDLPLDEIAPDGEKYGLFLLMKGTAANVEWQVDWSPYDSFTAGAAHIFANIQCAPTETIGDRIGLELTPVEPGFMTRSGWDWRPAPSNWTTNLQGATQYRHIFVPKDGPREFQFSLSTETITRNEICPNGTDQSMVRVTIGILSPDFKIDTLQVNNVKLVP